MSASLCESCRHMREVRTARSRFLLCELSLTNDAYAKYPRQPVVRCEGHEPRETAELIPTPVGGSSPPSPEVL